MLLTAVFCIPSSCLSANVNKVLDQISQEGAYPRSYIDNTQFDNYTVKIMVDKAAQHADNPFVAAMTGYPRYWHGYVVILRPLFCFLSLDAIRRLFQFITLFALCLLTALLASKYGRRGGGVGLMLSASYLLFGVAEASASLPFFFSFFVSLTGCATVCLIRCLNREKILILFSLLGIATAYFDFLDNPILTLGAPLALLLLRDWHEGLCPKTALVHVLLACGCWIISYGVFWASKWILSSIVLGTNVIENATSQAALRMGQEESGIPYSLKAIGANLRVTNLNCAIMQVLICAIIALAVLCLVFRSKVVNKAFKYSALFAVIWALPYAWYAILANHSVIHYWFTYRNQIVSLFSLICIVYLFIQSILDAKKDIVGGSK